MSRMTCAYTGNRLGLLSPARMVGLNLCSDKRGTSRDAGVMSRISGGVHGRTLPHRLFIAGMLFMCSNLCGASALLAVKPVKLAGRPLPPPASLERVTPEELAAARGLEQLLVDTMIQEMRKSVPESEFVPLSQGEKIFRQMLDSEYARTISEAGSIGVAELVVAQMKGKR